jgi:hypothetical protein
VLGSAPQPRGVSWWSCREDFLERDDENFTKPTMAYPQSDGTITLDWKPVAQTGYPDGSQVLIPLHDLCPVFWTNGSCFGTAAIVNAHR